MVMNISLNWQTVLVGVCFGLLSYYVIRRLKYRLPPGPWCVPIIGNVQGQLKVHGNGIENHLNRLCLRFSIFIKHNKTIFIVYTSRDPHRKVFKMVDKYGPVISVSFGKLLITVGWPWLFSA